MMNLLKILNILTNDTGKKLMLKKGVFMENEVEIFDKINRIIDSCCQINHFKVAWKFIQLFEPKISNSNNGLTMILKENYTKKVLSINLNFIDKRNLLNG